MVNIDTLLKKGNIHKLNDLEAEKYENFLNNSYKDNLEHSIANLNSFPRWSIISGYYAMHDITKLLLARKFRIKIDSKVHVTTINVLKELVKNEEIIDLIEKSYEFFLSLASDLEEAKRERMKVQYYLGTKFLSEEYKLKSNEFYNISVLPYITKLKELMK